VDVAYKSPGSTGHYAADTARGVESFRTIVKTRDESRQASIGQLLPVRVCLGIMNVSHVNRLLSVRVADRIRNDLQGVISGEVGIFETCRSRLSSVFAQPAPNSQFRCSHLRRKLESSKYAQTQALTPLGRVSNRLRRCIMSFTTGQVARAHPWKLPVADRTPNP
jgi:hypothetical protein